MSARRPSPGPAGEAAICERLVAEAAALCGARRVLLVLDAEAGPEVAAFLLPRREQPAGLLAAIAPWLDEARRTGKAKLRHGPEGVEARGQRSCLVAPLGRAASCSASSTPISTAPSAASTMPTATSWPCSPASRGRARQRARQGLERKVAERTVSSSSARPSWRSSTASRRAWRAELDFQAIVDLVGDKLREVFKSGDIGIRWYDPRREPRCSSCTQYEHGVRDYPPPTAPHADGAGSCKRAGARWSSTTGRVSMLRSDSRYCPAPIRASHRRGADPRRRPRIGLDRSRELRARECIRRVRGAPADDRRREHGRRARERAALRRDAAAAQGDRAARRRARGHQQHPAGHGRGARLPGHRRSRRRQAARGVRRPATSASAGTTAATGYAHYLYAVRARREAWTWHRPDSVRAAFGRRRCATRQPM